MKVLTNKIESFKKRWDINEVFDEHQEFLKFRVRILNGFKNVDRMVGAAGTRVFCQALAIEEVWQGYGSSRYSLNIFNELDGQFKQKEFYLLLELILSLPYEYGLNKDELLHQFKTALSFSRVNLEIVESQVGEVILYPKGVGILDQGTVNEVLSILNPAANAHFVDALRSYQVSGSSSARKSAESLRRTIEEFLRYKLLNSTGLAENLRLLGVALKQDGRDSQIRNIINQNFAYLDKYFNENSKHNDGDIDDAENEYLIYQTGTLLRFIDRVISTGRGGGPT